MLRRRAGGRRRRHRGGHRADGGRRVLVLPRGSGERADERVEQLGRLHRLGDEHADGSALGGGGSPGAERVEGDDGQCARSCAPPELALELVARARGEIDDRRVEASAARDGPQRVARAVRLVGGGAPAGQVAREHRAARAAFAHDEDATTRERRGGWVRAEPERHARSVERHLAAKDRADARGALDLDLPAHGLEQAPGDDEPEARPAESARRRGVELLEGLEQVGHALGRDADARVAHLDLHLVAAVADALGACLDVHVATLGELHGVRQEVDHDLAQATGVAEQSHGGARGELERELDVVARGLARHEIDRALDARAQVERHVLEVEVPRLDLREVEDVVDDREQVLAARLHHPQVLGLLRLERRLEQQVGEADDGVERRADLVAHVREKLALRVRGLLGACARLDERGLGAPALGHVVRDGVDALAREIGRAVPQQPAVRAVLRLVAVLELHGVVALREPRGGAHRRLAVLGVHELEVRTRAQLVARPAEHALPRGVELEQPSVERRGRQAGERGLEEPLVLGPRLERPALRLGGALDESLKLQVAVLEAPRLGLEGALAPHLLGEVGLRGDHAERAPGGVARGDAAAAHPHRRAALVAVADDLIARDARVRAVARDALDHRGHVVGLDEIAPAARRVVGSLDGVVAERAPEPRADPGVVGALEVPVPDAVQRALLEEREARRALADEGVELPPQVVVPRSHDAKCGLVRDGAQDWKRSARRKRRHTPRATSDAFEVGGRARGCVDALGRRVICWPS